jgi:hypothetical protein
MIYANISDKHRPVHRGGRLWRLDPDEIDTWVKSGGAAQSPENEDEGENG